jgi:uncharacterized protein YndB with AHSA1/START domain
LRDAGDGAPIARMPLDFIRLTSPLPASAARVYAAWLDSQEHSLMTGGDATVDPRVGGFHTAWGGYIGGTILDLEPGSRIVQSWRTSEFPEGHPHSRLEIRFRDVPGGCVIALAHSEIPEGQGEQYEAGWHEHYFIPMTRYFRGTSEAPPAMPTKEKAKPAKKVAKKKALKAKTAGPPKKAAKKKAAAKAPARGKTKRPKKVAKGKATRPRAASVKRGKGAKRAARPKKR